MNNKAFGKRSNLSAFGGNLGQERERKKIGKPRGGPAGKGFVGSVVIFWF